MGNGSAPAGVLRFGEKLQDGAGREVKEETGLDIRIIGHAMTYDRVLVERKKRVHVVFIGFQAVPLKGKLHAGSDAAYASWFTKSELREGSAEFHEDTKRLLVAAGLMKATIPA